MKVATYNMRQGGSHAHWLRVLETFEPDVLLAQETKAPALLANDLFRPLPIDGALWRPVEHGLWGSAVWVRPGLSVAEIAVPGFEGWVVGGSLEGLREPIFVFSVHMPPERGSYVRAANRLMDRLAPIVRGVPFFLGGDWNFTIASLGPEDTREHRSGELEFLARMAEEFDAEPAWRLVHPEGPLPQTLRWTQAPSTVFHCDGVFVSGALREAVTSATVASDSRWDEMSDHNPLIVEI